MKMLLKVRNYVWSKALLVECDFWAFLYDHVSNEKLKILLDQRCSRVAQAVIEVRFGKLTA